MRNDIILTFANLLVGNKIDTQTIIHSLKLICDNFLFDCGLLYENDPQNSLSLKEHYNPCHMQVRQNILVEEISAEICSQLKTAPFIYVSKTKCSTTNFALNHYFYANSVIILPLFDEDSSICGLIVLLDIHEKIRIDDYELESLTAILNMLSRYVSIRLYQ